MPPTESWAPRVTHDCIAPMIRKPTPREAHVTRRATASVGHRTAGSRGTQSRRARDPDDRFRGFASARRAIAKATRRSPGPSPSCVAADGRICPAPGREPAATDAPPAGVPMTTSSRAQPRCWYAMIVLSRARLGLTRRQDDGNGGYRTGDPNVVVRHVNRLPPHADVSGRPRPLVLRRAPLAGQQAAARASGWRHGTRGGRCRASQARGGLDR